MNIKTEISPADFLPEHPELHHYTSLSGFEGIFASQTIRAMQFDQLNDRTEFVVLKEPLTLALSDRFAELNKKHQHQSLKTGGSISDIANDQAHRIVSTFYESSFGSRYQRSAYVASFCTHPIDSYEGQSGLLSQWRGYGQGGGYCLVFDTARLLEMLCREFETHHWVSLRLDPVLYYTKHVSLEAAFASLLDEAEHLLSEFLQGRWSPEMAILHFMRAAPMLKHQGFREENEARIVAFPATQDDAVALLAERVGVPLPPLKELCWIDDNRGKRCYVPLFKDSGSRLPIKRVIIGPSNQQVDAAANASRLVGSSIKVVRSETPFIE
jgi:Protein of unknown function (DUF2971)